IKSWEAQLNQYPISPRLIHHSDRRSYNIAAKIIRIYLRSTEWVCSMSRKGNCYDNACAETFFGTIKCEMLYHKKYETRKEAHRDIFWYIEIFTTVKGGTSRLVI
ncbi:hypothetical protein DealDRAFT_2024, partial [Dethiobacter alkaliphilus AHT 1]